MPGIANPIASRPTPPNSRPIPPGLRPLSCGAVRMGVGVFAQGESDSTWFASSALHSGICFDLQGGSSSAAAARSAKRSGSTQQNPLAKDKQRTLRLFIPNPPHQAAAPDVNFLMKPRRPQSTPGRPGLKRFPRLGARPAVRERAIQAHLSISGSKTIATYFGSLKFLRLGADDSFYFASRRGNLPSFALRRVSHHRIGAAFDVNGAHFSESEVPACRHIGVFADQDADAQLFGSRFQA